MPEYRQVIHELNQRYKAAWDRAERLQDELDHVKRSRAYRLLTLWRRWSGYWRTSPKRESVLLPFASENLEECQVAPSGTVSILVPSKDRVDLLRNCLRGLRRTSYRDHEILLLDNGSTCPHTKRYLERGQALNRFKVIPCPGPFNFARICNQGARFATGDFLIFLNNDVEVSSSDWLDHLLRLGCAPAVGIVGATLLYPDGTLQHAGIFPQVNGQWSHAYRGLPQDHPGKNGELLDARTVPAVTGACLLIRRSLFQELGGFDEYYHLTMNDVDLCLRVRQRGLKVAITPHARLFHYESMSRGYFRAP
jgi:O-antigen biosynthesis protein